MYESALYEEAFTLACSALLRLGKFALSKGNIPLKIIHVGDITLIRDGELIKLCLDIPKLINRGMELQWRFMPHQTLHALWQLSQFCLQIRRKISGPLFCHFSGEPLTGYQFSSILNKTLDICNIDHTNFKSQSFRIGAAATLARQGADKEKIQIAGRWKSDIYFSYILSTFVELSTWANVTQV